MQAPFDNIVQHLFHQPSLHSVTVDELENMIAQHPYFAAAHFLLLKKMQDTAHPSFTSQLHKTSIYFNNPLWLQFLLQPEAVTNFTVSEKPPFINSDSIETSHEVVEQHHNGHAPETISEQGHIADETETTHQHEDESIAETTIHDSNPIVAPAEHSSMMDVITEVFSDPNPLYNMDRTEPIHQINTEETHIHQEPELTAHADEPIQETFNSHEQVAVEEINATSHAETATPFSDPWIELTNKEVHEEPVTYEQPVVEEINSMVRQEIKEQPAEVSWENNDYTKHEEHVIQENPVVEEINTIHAEHTVISADESITAMGTAPYAGSMEEQPIVVEEKNTEIFSERTHEDNHAVEATAEKINNESPEENISTKAPEAEIKQEKPTLPVMAHEQTSDHYIDGALEADATEHVPETAHSNGEPATKVPEPSFIKTIIETPAAKSDLLFEPYHTVDYFASQGIKLSKMEADSKDKFGRQLKSFTEWLKTMKRLPQSSINKILAENEESKVVADANHSIENKEVITVAMAEVFEKQGMNDKAAEIYQKLSLLNPTKSAYFAARIEALKH